jgi:metallophosphoesterase superfamily enzyme
MIRPQPPSATAHLADGVVAVPNGLVFLEEARALVCADAHFAYEDVMGGALPLWSTAEIATTIAIAAQRYAAREIVFLGDVIHGSRMSDGAARAVREALDGLRALATVTLVAGNHEGRTRGGAVLGATVEECERGGWLLVHGDKPTPLGTRTMIGHLHPSLHLGGGKSAPAFLGSRNLVVVPALNPYSSGLDVLSDDCIAALAPYAVARRDLHVVASGTDRVFPFGTLSALRGALRTRATDDARPHGRYVKRYLRGDR